MNKNKQRVIVIEYDEKFSALIRSLIETSSAYTMVNQYTTCEAALKQAKHDFPDIILMNIDFPLMDGAEAIPKLKQLFPVTNILIVTDVQEEDRVFTALSAGANGYILRDAWTRNFMGYLTELTQGGAPLSPSIARILVESMHTSPASPLTSREGQVLKLITEGNSYSRIASELKISKETSRSHIRNIYRKLNVNSKSEAVRKAFDERIVSKVGLGLRVVSSVGSDR